MFLPIPTWSSSLWNSEDEKGELPYLETDKALQCKIVPLVERMLKLHKDLPKARTAPDKLRNSVACLSPSG
jgi:hypothetical protein